MNRKFSIAALSLLLGGACGFASATETAKHNDMDGDGRSDLIWRNAGTGAIVYWSGGSASQSKQVSIAGSPYKMPAGFDLRRMNPVLTYGDDFGFPNRVALLVRDPTNGYIYELSPTSTGSYSIYEPGFGGNWLASGAGDFDGDGASDVFYRNQADGRDLLHEGANWGGWSGIYPAATLATVWKLVGIGDFDGDASSDVLWRNATTGQNMIWRSGNSATRLGIYTVASLDWNVATIGDFDGDGRSDIAWRNLRTGANVIWKSGNALTPQKVPSVTDLAWKIVATGDFDGDGKWDLVWRNTTTGANEMWKSGSRATRQALPAVAPAWSAVM